MVRTGGGGSHQQRKQTPRQPDSGRPETRVPDTDGGPGGTRACGLAVGFLAYRRTRAWKGTPASRKRMHVFLFYKIN